MLLSKGEMSNVRIRPNSLEMSNVQMSDPNFYLDPNFYDPNFYEILLS